MGLKIPLRSQESIIKCAVTLEWTLAGFQAIMSFLSVILALALAYSNLGVYGSLEYNKCLFCYLGTSVSIPIVKSDKTNQPSGRKLKYFKDVTLLSTSLHCFWWEFCCNFHLFLCTQCLVSLSPFNIFLCCCFSPVSYNLSFTVISSMIFMLGVC